MIKRCVKGTNNANLKHTAYSIHLEVNMKRTHSNEHRPLLGQITKIEETQSRTSIPIQENRPRMCHREGMQVNGLGAGIIGNPQAVLNPPMNQLIPTNPNSIIPTVLSVGIVGNSQSVLNHPIVQFVSTNPSLIRPTILNVGIIYNSQSALNPPANQFTSTNVRLITPSSDAISQPQFTSQVFPTITAALIKDELENAIQISGARTLEVLAYLTDEQGNTLLAHAAEHGHSKPIEILLSNVLNPQRLAQIKNNAGQSALLLTAKNGRANAITTLLKGVTNRQQLAEQTDDQGNSALHYAASYGHPVAITAILRDVSNAAQLAEQQNNFGYSALMLAADMGHVEVIASIFSAVNNRQQLAEQINNFGQTVLMNALLSGASALVITKILESIEDPEKLIFHVNNEGLNSFTYALKRGHIDAAIVLFDKAKDKNALLYKKNNPDQEAAIKMMKPEIQDIFLKKFISLIIN